MTTVERRRAQPSAPARPSPLTPALLGVIALIGVGIVVPILSAALGLYDRIPNLGKLVHALDGFCAALPFGLLLFGWREYERIDLTDELATLITICAGVLFGVLWEIVEFIRDWVTGSDLQKSNADTMTDFLCNDVAVIIAALIATRIATRGHVGGLGQIAEWIVDGPSRVL